jgi:hypothetical protein
MRGSVPNTPFSELQTWGGPIGISQGTTHLTGGPVTERLRVPMG